MLNVKFRSITNSNLCEILSRKVLIIIIINNYKVLNDAGQEEKFANTGKQNFREGLA